MSDWVARLAALYDAYLADMARAEASRANLRGAFGSLFGGPSAGDDSCNDRFIEGMGACIADFLAQDGGPESAAELLRYALEQTEGRKASRSARLMLQAVEGLLLPLIARITQEDAAAALAAAAAYEDPPLPCQKELRKALQARANG